MIVNNAKAKSTQLHDNETVEFYTSKCEKHTAEWARVSDALWIKDHETRIDHKVEADKMWESIKNIPKVDVGTDPETKKKEACKLKFRKEKNGKNGKKSRNCWGGN